MNPRCDQCGRALDEATYFPPPPPISPATSEAEIDARMRALGYELNQDGKWTYQTQQGTS